MAIRKFEGSGRGKRSFSKEGNQRSGNRFGDRPKRTQNDQEGRGERKSFISKFKRKEGGAQDKPERSNQGRGFGKPAGRRSFGDEEKGARKPFARKQEGGRKEFGDRDKSFKKPFGRKQEGGRSEYSDRGKKPFGRKSEGGFSDKPAYERTRAFSAGKKYFKSKPKSTEAGSEEGSRPSRRPEAGKGFFAPRRKTAEGFSKPRKFSGGRRRDVMKELAAEKTNDGLTRLNKFIANSGVCSRREADDLIKMGLISVNGTVITEMGYKVKPGDEVRYENKKLTAEKPVYILMNKPKGYITTTDDPQERKTVMSLLGSSVKERVYPVGRLDRNTTGLLLLTNDGSLADKLMHPSYKAKKIYRVELDKALTKADFDKIVEGVRLEEGKAVVDDLAYVDGDPKIIGIEIHIGWNRVVRRIFEMMGYEVVKLDRVVYAGLDKKTLGRGEWRYLKDTEVVKLKHLK